MRILILIWSKTKKKEERGAPKSILLFNVAYYFFVNIKNGILTSNKRTQTHSLTLSLFYLKTKKERERESKNCKLI